MTGRFNIATILVPLGLIFIGTIFLIVGITGGRPTPLIFGGLCVLAGLAAIIALVASLFRKKPRNNADSLN
ncbi:MAG: hypothetical protein V1823_03230 [Chloroflexota bacterium]